MIGDTDRIRRNLVAWVDWFNHENNHRNVAARSITLKKAGVDFFQYRPAFLWRYEKLRAPALDADQDKT